jgi:2-polyprenyl-3-methyl-5-hydroxy-6-metoxy-1,4-benzoquinol methylase
MYKKIEKCLCCDGNNLKFVLDLNQQPLANSYLKEKMEKEDVFPLGINYCVDCTHIQLTDAVDPNLLFKNYLYVSGTTKTLKDYFDWFVFFANQYTKGKNVLDIACNDGSQLNAFKSHGYNTYGIDPAENLYSLSSANHTVVCDYLTDDSLNKLNTKFDIIIAQNVFAHNTYPKEFLEKCKSALNDNGCIFIQTSQADMVQNSQFDTIYHEHISFFSVKSFCTLANRAGLNVIDVVRTSVHGTSFVFVLSKDKENISEEYIDKEFKLTEEIMEQYAKDCKEIAKETFDKINKLYTEGYKVIGYGAAAKGNTFLNFSMFKLNYIVDDNPLKQGLYSPGSRIPIYSPDKLLEESNKICVVPLAWNFFDEIKQKVLSRKNDNVVFLKYFPKVEII